MDPITMAMIGAGVGLAKSELIDRPKAAHQRRQEAEIARWSPWTGMQARRVQEAQPFGSAMQGAMGLGMLGANMKSADAQNALAAKLGQTGGGGNLTATPMIGGSGVADAGGGIGLVKGGLQFNRQTAGMPSTLPMLGQTSTMAATNPYLAAKMEQDALLASNQALQY